MWRRYGARGCVRRRRDAHSGDSDHRFRAGRVVEPLRPVCGPPLLVGSGVCAPGRVPSGADTRRARSASGTGGAGTSRTGLRAPSRTARDGVPFASLVRNPGLDSASQRPVAMRSSRAWRRRTHRRRASWRVRATMRRDDAGGQGGQRGRTNVFPTPAMLLMASLPFGTSERASRYANASGVGVSHRGNPATSSSIAGWISTGAGDFGGLTVAALLRRSTPRPWSVASVFPASVLLLLPTGSRCRLRARFVRSMAVPCTLRAMLATSPGSKVVAEANLLGRRSRSRHGVHHPCWSSGLHAVCHAGLVVRGAESGFADGTGAGPRVGASRGHPTGRGGHHERERRPGVWAGVRPPPTSAGPCAYAGRPLRRLRWPSARAMIAVAPRDCQARRAPSFSVTADRGARYSSRGEAPPGRRLCPEESFMARAAALLFVFLDAAGRAGQAVRGDGGLS